MAKSDLIVEIDSRRVGRRLALVRRVVDVTQDEFAAKAGLSRTAYNQYENGSKLPSIKAATHLCVAYDLDLNYIFHGEMSGLRGWMIDAIKALSAAKSEQR